MTNGYIDLDGTGNRAPTDAEMLKVRGILAAQGRSTPKIVIAGDSRANNHKGALLWSVRGPVCWARYYANCRFDIDHAWVTGIAGTQIAVDNGSGISLLNQLPAAFALNPGFIACFSDVNDITNGRTGAQMIADMTLVINAILTEGVVPILFTCVVPTIWSATQRTYHDQYNNWLRSRATDGRIIVIDAEQRVVDWASTTSQPIGTGANGYLFDTTHFGPLSAELIGIDLAAALSPFLPPEIMRGFGSPTDIYDAAINPKGALTPKGYFSAAGGLLTDIAGNAGSAAEVGSTSAANCRLYKTNGNSILVSGSVTTGTITINGKTITVPVQKMLISSGGTGLQTGWFKLPDLTTGFVAGDIIQAEAHVKVNTSVGLYGASLQLYDMTSGSINQNYGDLASWSNAGTYSFLQAMSRAGVLRSSRMTVSPSVTLLRPFIVAEVNGATASIDLEIANYKIFKPDA